MGVNHSKHNHSNSKEISFRAETRTFLSLYKTSIKLLPETVPLSMNMLKIKEMSSLSNNINSRTIEELGLELYSEILSRNNKVNEALYHPVAVVKLNNNKDSLDFIKYQNEYLNDLVVNFEHSNKVKLNEIEEHVSSIKTNTVDSIIKRDQMNKSNTNNTISEDKNFPQIQTDKIDKGSLKLKNEDQYTVNSLLNQMSRKDSYNSKSRSINSKGKSVNRINSRISFNGVGDKDRPKSELYYNMNNSLFTQKQNQSTGRGNNMKSAKNLINLSSKNISRQSSKKYISKQTSIKFTSSNNFIGKSKTNPRILKQFNTFGMNPSDSDKQYNCFVNKAMNKIPMLTEMNQNPLHTSPDDGGKSKSNRSKYNFNIEIVSKEERKDNSSLNKSNTNRLCKKYFKLNKEIEEEEIINKYYKPKNKKNYKIHIDLRKIPDEVLEINDSSNISNDRIS